MAAAYMPTGPGSSGQVSGGQALAGSSQVPGRRRRTPSVSTSRTGRCSWAPKRTAATWPISHTSPQAANSSAATTNQKVSGTCCWSRLGSRSCHICVASSPASAGTGRLGLAQADAAAALAVGGVVGVVGAEAMAALAVGLAGLGMAGGCPTAMGATGPLEGDEAADELLRLAAPDVVLLAGPDREGQAGISHQARLADGDGFTLELRGVGEEGVVLGCDQLTAGGLITPAAGLAHAARPPCRHATRAARWTMGLAGAASIWLADWASRPSSGRCIGGRREAWGSADASGCASGTPRDRVESEGPSGTSHGLSLLLRRHAAGSDGAGWEAFGLAHNPEVEGSNPSPATKLTRDFAPHLLSRVGGVARFGSRIGSIAARRAHGSDI